MKGVFIVSLDYELFWGMQDVIALDRYKDNVLGTYTVIPKLLDLFERFEIHSTWATVGMMHANGVEDLRGYIPAVLPTYKRTIVNTYGCLDAIEDKDGLWDRYFFASDMIDKIQKHAGVEIGSHTFSHYYCDESGQTKDQFINDIVSDKRIRGCVQIRSFVFPRNQSIKEYIDVIEREGISVYRGVEDNWIHRIKSKLLMRTLRLVDTYIPITGTNEYIPESNSCMNLHGSRMFKPYNPKLKIFEKLKMHRIKNQMLNAAKNNKAFHLWFHPHNIGINQDINLEQLEFIFEYYKYLKEVFGFESMNMREAEDYFRREGLNHDDNKRNNR